MSFIADTHVHIYPAHNAAVSLRAGLTNLAALAPGLPRVLCLTERAECRFFRDVVSGAVKLPLPFSAIPAGKSAFVAMDNGGEKLFVIAGRQIATGERLEISCLGSDEDFPDGISAREAIGRVRDAGGVPVIPWGVGKWLGSRGRLVAELIGENSDLFAGDSSLRPRGWPEKIFSLHASRTICGTDPLPAPGAENETGRYATIFNAPFDEHDPATSLRAALRTGNFSNAGERCGPLEVWRRLRAMKSAGR